MAGALEAIPFLGVFFMFTNNVAGALWAASIESMNNRKIGSFRYAGRQKAHKFLTGYHY